jgi:23S rRNA (uracil1939-C5)-methyltransferase
VNPGAEVRFAIADLDDEGAGVGVGGGGGGGDVLGVGDSVGVNEIHVRGALPGEEISAHIEHLSTHRPVAWGTLSVIHRPSSERVAPTCRAYGNCGGCVLQHFSVRAQLAWKEASLRRQVTADPILAAVPIAQAVPSPRALGYRNNSKLAAGRDAAGGLLLGGYAPRSHEVVDLAGCTVIEPALEEVAAGLRAILSSHSVAPYDERRQVGTLRHAILRANGVGQVLVTLVTATDELSAGTAVASALQARHSNVIGMVQNVNPSRGNAIFGTEERTLAGAGAIEDQIGGVRLRISPRAFFQANRMVAQAAYDTLARAVVPAPADRVVDAYAGVGGIALTLASRVGSVIGIESHPGAVADATASARLNGIENARFVAGDVADHLAALEGQGAGADIVVLNPPRKGCAPAVLRCTAALRPRTIAYLSCAPVTLLRDLTALAGFGYRALQLIPFDMLPHTPHLEVLAILTTGHTQ